MLLLNYSETKKKEHQLKTVPKVLRDDFQQLVDMGQFDFEHRTELTARGETHQPYNLKELWDKRNDNDADDAADDDDADADAAAAAAAADDDDDAAAADDDEDEVEEDDEESEEPGS